MDVPSCLCGVSAARYQEPSPKPRSPLPRQVSPFSPSALAEPTRRSRPCVCPLIHCEHCFCRNALPVSMRSLSPCVLCLNAAFVSTSSLSPCVFCHNALLCLNALLCHNALLSLQLSVLDSVLGGFLPLHQDQSAEEYVCPILSRLHTLLFVARRGLKCVHARSMECAQGPQTTSPLVVRAHAGISNW